MKDKGLEKFPRKPCNVSTFKLFNLYNVLKERKEKLLVLRTGDILNLFAFFPQVYSIYKNLVLLINYIISSSVQASYFYFTIEK